MNKIKENWEEKQYMKEEEEKNGEESRLWDNR